MRLTPSDGTVALSAKQSHALKIAAETAKEIAAETAKESAAETAQRTKTRLGLAPRKSGDRPGLIVRDAPLARR
jgi:hypothetical protein